MRWGRARRINFTPRSTAPESMAKRRWMVRRSNSLASSITCRCVEITPSICLERNRNPLASAETPPTSSTLIHTGGLRPATLTLSRTRKISPPSRLYHLVTYSFLAGPPRGSGCVKLPGDRTRGRREQEERHEHKLRGHTPRDRHRRRPTGERGL